MAFQGFIRDINKPGLSSFTIIIINILIITVTVIIIAKILILYMMIIWIFGCNKTDSSIIVIFFNTMT